MSICQKHVDPRDYTKGSSFYFFECLCDCIEFFHDGGPYHVETSPLIWGANQQFLYHCDFRHERVIFFRSSGKKLDKKRKLIVVLRFFSLSTSAVVFLYSRSLL